MSYKIESLDNFGKGVTHIDGKVAFISNALEYEEVDVDITSSKSKYIEGESFNISNLNSNRREFPCPYYLECGGCNIMHMNYQRQLEFKMEKARNVLEKIAGISNEIETIIPNKEFGYRNKVTLKVRNGKIGFYKNKTYTLVPICKCLLCSDAINNVIDILNKCDLSSLEEVVIRSNYKNEILLLLKGDNIDSSYFLNHLKDVDNIILLDKSLKRVIKGNDYFIDKIKDLYFKVSIESFFQVNYEGVTKLYDTVLNSCKLSSDFEVLDLYCGTGTIGMFLSRNVKNVFGIEINKDAVEDANYNKELNKISNVNFLCSDVGLVKEKFKGIDLVVVDPPRSGLSREALLNVLDIKASNIVYVSCDVSTLARDLNILKETYNVLNITLVDMFPNTYHVETVILLKLKSALFFKENWHIKWYEKSSSIYIKMALF